MVVRMRRRKGKWRMAMKGLVGSGGDCDGDFWLEWKRMIAVLLSSS